MPRKRVNKSPPIERRSDGEDDDFFFDDSQSNSGRNSHEPQHRNAANARERARMRVLSKAFCRLKTTLPWVPADTKLSKLDTLRLAASYIAHLRALLHDEPRTAAQLFPHPLNLAWPFAFQHGGSLSCSVSPRWNNTSPTNPAQPNTQEKSQGTHVTRTTPNRFNPELYNQEYPENDYEKRCYHDDNMDANAITPCESSVQYCNYGYKETYYELRSSAYPSDRVINNV